MSHGGSLIRQRLVPPDDLARVANELAAINRNEVASGSRWIRQEQWMLIFRDEEIQEVVRIVSETPQPRVVIFGGIHGDEVSGIHAIEKVLFDFLGARGR